MNQTKQLLTFLTENQIIIDSLMTPEEKKHTPGGSMTEIIKQTLIRQTKTHRKENSYGMLE